MEYPPTPTGTPTYVRLGHSHATAGVYFKSWALRKTWKTRASCLWCHAPEAECGLHFLACPSVPPEAAEDIHLAIILIHYNHHNLDAPADPLSVTLPEPAQALTLQHVGHLHWSNMKKAIVIRVLKALARVINQYRSTWRPEPGTDVKHNNPITYCSSSSSSSIFTPVL